METTIWYNTSSAQALEELDPEWGENVPVSLEVVFSANGHQHSKSLPIDYEVYAGWYYGPNGEGQHLAAALVEQPGLEPYVHMARELAKQFENGSPGGEMTRELALAAAAAVTLRKIGLRYIADPLYVRGDRAVYAYQQFPVETLYYGGDCEDFTILYGHFLHRLGVPFAMGSTRYHIMPLVELGRGPDATEGLPEAFRSYAMERTCGETVCSYLPVDLTIEEAAPNEGSDWEWFAEIVTSSGRIWEKMSKGRIVILNSADTRFSPLSFPQRSWLGGMTFYPSSDG